jgi:hypothetical protein
MKITIPSHLSDDDLVAEVKSLAMREQTATAHLIAHLAELDARRLHLAAGFSSLFTYCTEVLGLSEAEAYNRIEAARTARRFPVILDMLGEGILNLTTVRLLARHLTAENHEALLTAAARKSRRQVEELLAGHSPQPDVAPSVRKLPATTPTLSPATPAASVLQTSALSEDVSLPIPPAPSTRTRRPMVIPRAPDRYEVRFTASAETCEKLRLAQDLLRHAIPTGDLAQIIDRALTVLLEDLARKKFAATNRPRASHGTALGSRDIPAKVQRTVWLRDGGRCAFVGKGGRRCNGRAFIEFHHVDPHGVGGEPTVENVGLRCRAHNAYEAELFYGRSAQLVLERVAHPARSPASTTP